jgi:toluene monooxygenase system protein A
VKTVTERLVDGEIQPPDMAGVIAWMGLTPDVMGDDGDAYRWAEEYR